MALVSTAMSKEGGAGGAVEARLQAVIQLEAALLGGTALLLELRPALVSVLTLVLVFALVGVSGVVVLLTVVLAPSTSVSAGLAWKAAGRGAAAGAWPR
jgi:hypothetical protein